MTEFEETFRRAVTAVLAETAAIRHEWTAAPLSLRIHPSSESGFDVKLVCESYGIYPYAGGWHGAPWDDGVWSAEALTAQLQEFLRSVLSPAGELEVRYANRSPYRWILRYSFQRNRVADEAGLLLFNWFGKRTRQTFRNEWLPRIR